MVVVEVELPGLGCGYGERQDSDDRLLVAGEKEKGRKCGVDVSWRCICQHSTASRQAGKQASKPEDRESS